MCVVHVYMHTDILNMLISIANGWLHWVGGRVGGQVSADHKSSNRIELSRIGQALLNFE